MNLSERCMAYLSEELNVPNLTHKYLDKICRKLEVSVDLTIDESKGGALDDRVEALLNNLNNTPKVNELIKIIITEYAGRRYINGINRALKMSGYQANENGDIIEEMGEIVDFVNTQSKIEEDLKQVGFNRVLSLFIQGIEEYGKGNEFHSLRAAIQGLVTEILKKEGLNYTGNIRDDMNELFNIGVLNNNPDPFRIEGKAENLELIHAYAIYSLLSHYFQHYGDISEEEKHFLFFQSVGLIWLLLNRYLKYLQNKT